MSKIKLLHEIKEPTQQDYDKARTTYIADYTEYKIGHYEGGGWFSVGIWVGGVSVHKPSIAEANWNKLYPKGYDSWVESNGTFLNYYGIRQLLRKVNEVAKELNKQEFKEKL